MNKINLKEIEKGMKFAEFCNKNDDCSTCPLDKFGEDCEKTFDDYKHKKYDYYIAAPFFNPDQVTRVELVKSILDNKGLTYFSPKDDSAVTDINDPENRKKVFALNHESISASRGVIAITDGKDPGTIWEAGFAYANNIPVIYIAFTLGKDGLFNLMLAESGVAACRTVDELKAAIDGQSIYFEGNIE